MKTCLNTITTKGRPLADDIRFCREVGFQGVEIDFAKLEEFLATNNVEDLCALLEENNVHCAGLMAVACSVPTVESGTGVSSPFKDGTALSKA